MSEDFPGELSAPLSPWLFLHYSFYKCLHESETLAAGRFPGPRLENAKAYLFSAWGSCVWQMKTSEQIFGFCCVVVKWHFPVGRLEAVHCWSGYLSHPPESCLGVHDANEKLTW